MKWTDENSAAASQQGWDISYTAGNMGHALYEVQGLTEPPEGVTPITDRQAHIVVKDLIDQGASLGKAVEAFLREHSPRELDVVIQGKHEGWA